MPSVRANGLDIGYDVQGAGPPLVMLHGATSIGREDFAAAAARPVEGLPGPPAGRARPRPTRWDAADGFRYDWLVDDLAGVRRRARARDVPPARVLDGRDDRAPVRHPPAGPVADAHRRRDHHAARAARERGPPADGPGADPGARSGLRRDAGAPPRCRPGRRGVAAAAPGDRRRHRGPAAPHAGRAPPDRLPVDGRLSAIATRSSRRSTPPGWPGSCPAAGCSSRPTAATRSWPAGRACSTRPSSGFYRATEPIARQRADAESDMESPEGGAA